MIKEYLEKNKEGFKPWLVDNEQGRIEIKILPYLQDIKDGFFVEAGALDGLFMSNTKILEDLGWNGLLIEPSPKAVDKCRQNRKSTVVECALVSKDYKGTWISGDFFFDGQEGEGAWSGVTRNTAGLRMAKQVPAKTLDEVLNFFNIKKVDFLSLDVEGYELNVLKGIDFDKVDIRFILVEVNFKDYSLEDIDKFLLDKGFKNLGNISNFTKDNPEGWDGSHQDYLYGKS